MERYVTSTELKQELRTVKAYARKGVVHITENGRAAFVLCSSKVFEREMRIVRERAVWDVAVQDLMEQSERDVLQGRVLQVGDVVDLGERGADRLMVCLCASREIASHSQAEPELWREQLLALGERPSIGLTLEYDGSNRPHKIQVPPYDVIYTIEKDGTVLVRGIVKSVGI